MTLSGPNACLGSTKDVKIFAAFLHSPVQRAVSISRRCRTRLRGSGLLELGKDLLPIDDGSGLLIPRGMAEFVQRERELEGDKESNVDEEGRWSGSYEEAVSQWGVGRMTADTGRQFVGALEALGDAALTNYTVDHCRFQDDRIT